MIGALRFLSTIYNKIYFLCKYKYHDDIKRFFENSNIVCVPFNENNEVGEIYDILEYAYNANDILVCGSCQKKYFRGQITNKKLLDYIPIDKGYMIDFDTIDTSKDDDYKVIEGFYRDLNLNLTYFFEYFSCPSTKESLEYYKLVKKYDNIIFIQLVCSDGRKLNITQLLEKYLHDKNSIIVCCNSNIYDIQNKTDDIVEKYNICQRILDNSKIINYNDIILNSNEIYIIDSCFTGIVLPYAKTNRLKAHKVRIICRWLIDEIVL